MAELIQGADGNYYTTTFAGGSGACPDDVQGLTPGCGAVVKITPAGVFSVLYSFPFDSSNNTTPNGMFPVAGLLQGRTGISMESLLAEAAVAPISASPAQRFSVAAPSSS
jgi:hypothetical protein